MADDDDLRLSCTEQVFINAFREQGFLSSYIEEAVPAYVRPHANWFAHAEALNRAGLDAFYRRDNEVVGLSSQHPVSLSIRMTFRALSAFQGALILYRRAMVQEGDTLARNVYEAAFWLGYLHEDGPAATRALLNDERRSQKARASYYLEQFSSGAYDPNPEIEAQLRVQVAELKSKIAKADDVSAKDAAKLAGLYDYYETYKHLSAGSAHASLNSLHRYLNRNPDGSYDGHMVGPDPDSLVDSLPVLCIGLGIALAMFCTIVALDHPEDELQALLIRTDKMRKAQKAAGGGTTTMA
ncbi:MAG TPA: hypothetical protein DCL34_12760 [Erythrobacter sp.]|nr:hypothetical protein [Erythrobacter sp.]|tara:strand:+ start:4844 stop:5734 length:891 start_codon:yes stop_codon:yes gene_type:complete